VVVFFCNTFLLLILRVSQSVPRSGVLFESFFCHRASKRVWASFTKADKGLAATTPMTRAFEDEVFGAMSLKWYGWVLSTIADRGVGGKQQLFHVSTLVKFLGLSRSGQALLSNLGFNCTLRFSDDQHDDMLDLHEQLRYGISFSFIRTLFIH
jgi:hypothetical protein